MSTLLKTGLLIMVIMVLGFCSNGATNVVPGFVLYGGLEHLSGKLLFLIGEPDMRPSYPGKLASIYGFNLANGVLQKIIDTPSGNLVVSNDGGIICVISYLDWGSTFGPAKAFVYKKGAKNGQTIDLARFPDETVIVKDHVFFVVADDDQQKLLIEYDITRDLVTDVVPRGRGVWCDSVHLATGSSGLIHFKYWNQVFKQATRYCAYDISAGVVRDMAGPCSCENDHIIEKSTEGNFVFLRGRDPPIHGRDLVSTQRAPDESKDCAINGYSVKLIKRFPRLSNGDYTFHGLDPSCKYALVVSDEWVFRWFRERWLKRCYFAINISNGSTSVIAEDRLDRDSKFFCRGIKWVPASH